MRDYGKVAPSFWTGETGRILRELGRDEQLLALFLITGPNANMIGLYHLPLPSICHYLRWNAEGALKGLRRVSEGGFCRYDTASETVFVPEMASYQLGEPLDKKDNRVKGIIREWNVWRKSIFYMDFYQRYKDSFHLPKPSPLQAPPKPGTGTGTGTGTGEGEDLLPGKPAKRKKSRTPSDDAPPSDTAPVVRPRDELFDAVVALTGADPKVNGAHIGRVCKSLRSADPAYTAAEVQALPQAIAAAGLDFTITIGSVEKYISWVRTPPSHGGKANSPQLNFSGIEEFVRRGKEQPNASEP